MSTLLNSVNQSAALLPSSPPAVAGGNETPDPEVVGRAVRRRFTAAYKQRILAEVEAATGTGAVGRILRREGLYSSQLTSWRKARTNSDRLALAPKKRGPKPVPKNPLQAENLQLKRENTRLHKQLHTAELMIDLQKKFPNSWASPCRCWSRTTTTR